jgi:hypothetical protein
VSEQTPREAVVIPELVERRNLSAGPEGWAGALAQALERPRGLPGETCRRLRARGFDVAESFSTLTRIYEQDAGQRAGVVVPAELMAYRPNGLEISNPEAGVRLWMHPPTLHTEISRCDSAQ